MKVESYLLCCVTACYKHVTIKRVDFIKVDLNDLFTCILTKIRQLSKTITMYITSQSSY